MITVNEHGHIQRESDSPAALKRKEIAERLSNSLTQIGHGSTVFDAFEQVEPRIAIVRGNNDVSGLALLDSGVLKVEQFGRTYRIFHAFSIDDSVEKQLSTCQTIMFVLSLFEANNITNMFKTENDCLKAQQVAPEQLQIDWAQVVDWLNKCPLQLPPRTPLIIY